MTAAHSHTEPSCEALSALADAIIAGKRLRPDDPEVSLLLTGSLDALMKGADRIRAHYKGDKVDLCTIINGRSGLCGEDCKYCAQSLRHHTACEVYEFLDLDRILEEARHNQMEGVDRFSIVTSGRALTGEEFEKALEAFRIMHDELKLELCASMGFLTAEQFHALHEAGVSSYHDNIETSRRYFPAICTTHTFDQKLATIRAAKAEGLCVCSGGIIGMGETWEDRIDMAFTLADLEITSIPINVLMAVPGTPLENQPPLPPDDVLRTIAAFRYINPTANIRLAGGRRLLPDNGKSAFECGASASITGDMLTTSGSTIASDRAMLSGLGRDVTPVWDK